MAMLQTVRDVCVPHPMALDYAMGEQIEHLSDLLVQTEKDAEAFLDKNYVTVGMQTLLHHGLQRLAGQSDQAVFELKQAVGGGKTHSMVALGVLARNPTLRDCVPAEITGSEFATSLTRAALYALYELQQDVDGSDVLAHLRDLVTGYLSRREDMAAIANYIAHKRSAIDDEEAAAARIRHALIRNERLG